MSKFSAALSLPTTRVTRALATFGLAAIAGVSLIGAYPAQAQAYADDPLSAYKRKELSLLRSSCKSTSLLKPLTEPGLGIRKGWAWQSAKLSERRGDWLVLDVSRNSAISYKWETLTSSTTAVNMKLSLPRDLSSCAFVTLPNGTERLEVVNKSVLIRGHARDFWNQAQVWHGTKPTCPYVYNAFSLVKDGVAQALPACLSSQTVWMQDALSWINRAQLR